MPEARDVLFRFSKLFRYAYNGIDVVTYEAGDEAKVSAECASIATKAGAGSVVAPAKAAAPVTTPATVPPAAPTGAAKTAGK